MADADLTRSPILFLDTEFVWNKTYYPKLGLVQCLPTGDFPAEVFAGKPPRGLTFQANSPAEQRAVLIDPLHTPGEMLAPAFAHPGIVKVFHDVHTDLPILARWSGVRLVNVFDTRLAAGFCGMKSTISLAALVKETIGLELPKTETRSDWLVRPLNPRQLAYAAQDVAYMEDVLTELTRRAATLGTLDWMFEEMSDACSDPALYEELPDNQAWKRVHAPPHLFRRDPLAAHRLRTLAAWREETARERDLPRRWVAADEFIVDSALHPPARPVSVSKRLLSPTFVRSFEAALIRCERDASGGADLEAMFPVLPKDADDVKDFATRVLHKIAELAGPLQIDPVLYGTRAEIEAWARDPEAPEHRLNIGWRYETVGQRLLDDFDSL